MLTPDFTTIVAVDQSHLEQLRMVWPTWVRFRPEIGNRPMLFVCDVGDETLEQRSRKLHMTNAIGTIVRPGHWHFNDPPRIDIHYWSWRPDLAQRERMLTAIVRVAGCGQIDTPYFLKIDTDAYAIRHCEWIKPEWFDGNPAIIASPWGYTTPAHWIDLLDQWAEHNKHFPGTPPLAIPYSPGARTVSHPRIASWVMFGRTDFARWCSSLVPDGERLPVPSQDTYTFYCAKRAGEPIRTVKFKTLGWANASTLRRLKGAVADVLAADHPHTTPDDGTHVI